MGFIFKSNVFGLILLIVLTYLLIYLNDRYVLNAAFFDANGDPLSGIPDREADVYTRLQKWIYVFEGFYLIVKICIITLLLYTALFLSEKQVSFEKILKVVIYAEFIFLIPATIKIIWFHWNYPHPTLQQWNTTYIFSALSLVPSAPADMTYLLQSLNVFEVGYWFLLAYGLSRISTNNFD